MTADPWPDGFPAPADADHPRDFDLPWPVDAPDLPFPEPEDRGAATLSDQGETEYIHDLVRPGRIAVVAAEEGTGKSYAVGAELPIRLALGLGSFADTWPVVADGPVLVLSEMHPDDDYDREDRVLTALGKARADLSGRYYRLSLMTAARGVPPLTSPPWRSWITTWLQDHGVILAVFDTATAAAQVDPWGREIQVVFAALRAMLDDYPALAIVLVVHLRKPQGGAGRRLSDVLGEWGRWCDVVLLMEPDGGSLERVQMTARKRVRQERRIVATKRDGLLVDAVDITEGTGPKVPLADVVAAIVAEPGLSQRQLAGRLGVAESTARGYAQAAEAAGMVAIRPAETGRGKALYPVSDGGAGVRDGAASASHPVRTPSRRGTDGEGVRGAGGYIYPHPLPSHPTPVEETEADLVEQVAAWDDPEAAP